MGNEKNSKKTKTQKRDIRKYLNFILLMILLVLIAFIASKLYKNHQENKLGTSVFYRDFGTIQYDDIENMISEMPSDSFIFISYTKKEDVKKLESSLKKSVVDKGLQSNFYYLDATDIMLTKDFIQNLNAKFNVDKANEIESLPALIYFQDGTLKRTITSTKSRQMTVDDFNKLIDNYEIIDSSTEKKSTTK